jgi:multidrug resistance efflux pump
MRHQSFADLTECTEFRQTLQARPPRFVHGTAILLAALLATGLCWLALTRADLVVRAPGRVRPRTAPTSVFTAGQGGGSIGWSGRVVAVYFRQGDEVHKGDLLIQLDTQRLENEIAKRTRTVATGEEELAKVIALEQLSAGHLETAKAKAAAELTQAQQEVRQAKERQATDVRLAQIELESAREAEGRLRRLCERRAAAEEELAKARARLREAQAKWERARLPVDESKVEVLGRAQALVDKEHALKREELALRREAKRGEIATARLELANLQLERKQAELRAPIDGVVTVGDFKVGDLLEPGKAVMEIAEQKGFHFEMAVPSEEVGHVRVGMPVQIKLDAYDYQRYGTATGEVVFIAPDSRVPEGQQAAAYVVKVVVMADEVGRDELQGRIKLGMTGQAEIVTGQESLLTLLVKKIRQRISLG